MKKRIYITRKIPGEIKSLLEQDFTVDMWHEEHIPIPKNILKEKITQCDGLFCLLTEEIDAKLIEHAKSLKVISNMAVGFNNIDVETATKYGIAVTNTPGVLTETTADLTFALLMATARRIPEAEQYLRSGKWETWSPMLLTGQDIWGATLGLIGLGRIGTAVVKRAKGFGMNVMYTSRTQKPEVEEQLDITYKRLEDLLQQSDFICVMTPYTKETENLISTEQFNLMKKNAILINTARGGIVNEQALVEAIQTKKIWGAGLDVFASEPISKDDRLLQLPNVVTLPHIGSASIQTRMRMAKLAAENIKKVLLGEDCDYILNPDFKNGATST
ncbi:2-hydroxyacid dehydrogenase [Alkalihalobacterium bogoriense]|uniref:2-hydroxyacid dehydrogenase n=1 Tax=Alkalihalobacterium bogoriense TaxID=246272 RepID=UPI00047BF2E6|nr:D-glycerate dehydrogenase [Alkalihalobacterium bogoriense]